MSTADEEPGSHSLATVANATGLSPHVLRAWERRYRAIEPIRTSGGTRRYRDSDVDRLRLLKSAVDAGQRIGRIAQLSREELIERLERSRAEPHSCLEQALEAVSSLDCPQLEGIAREELLRLGPTGFAGEFALPLLQAIGDGWVAGKISMAGEHLASSLLRSLLGGLLTDASAGGELHVVFATPEGEAHELGTLAAAIVASASGARVTYLGADLPGAELQRVVDESGADALALGFTHLRVVRAREILADLDQRISDRVEIWIGGAHCGALAGGRIHAIPDLEVLKHRITAHAAISSS